jgi:hypothetical protein
MIGFQIEFPGANASDAFGIVVDLLGALKLEFGMFAIANIATGVQHRTASNIHLFNIDQNRMLMAMLIDNNLLNIGDFSLTL